LVEMAKKGSTEFVSLTQEATSHRYLQVGEQHYHFSPQGAP